MAVRVADYMTFLEFLRLTNTSRRREVKERVDPLTKYDDSEFHARFRLSKLTVHHLLSDVCQTVHLPSLCDPYTAKIREIYIATVMNDTSMAFFRHHALCSLGLRLPGVIAA